MKWNKIILSILNGCYFAAMALYFNERENNIIVKNLCKELIIRCGFDLKTVDVIMSTLFLSMTPLHDDDIQRQKAMYLHGLYLLNKGLKNENLH